MLYKGKPVNAVTVPRLSVGEFPFENVTFAVISRQEVLTLVQEPVDGLLGISNLSRFAIPFDFFKHELTFFYPGKFSEMELQQAGFSANNSAALILMSGSPLMTVPVRLNDQVVSDLVIDTGAGATFLSPELADTLRLKPTKVNQKVQSVTGSYRRMQLLSFFVAGQKLTDSVVLVPQKGSATKRPALGIDFLKQYRVLMDFPQSRLYLQPSQQKIVAPAQ